VEFTTIYLLTNLVLRTFTCISIVLDSIVWPQAPPHLVPLSKLGQQWIIQEMEDGFMGEEEEDYDLEDFYEQLNPHI
jgi:hypothetical protein